jgi:hypothetical protein
MALQDHFHPPLSIRRHWHAFHNSWATYISSQLNQRLPEGYFAEANVQFGIEIDVATFEETKQTNTSERVKLPAKPDDDWLPPTATETVPISLIDESVEVTIFSKSGGPTLAGAIELVSPANKDRAEHRNAFVSKCAAYLQQGIGLVIVDVVTERTANLHDELLVRLQVSDAVAFGADLYAVAYRPIEREGKPHLDIWRETLALGRVLPTVPLWLKGEICLPVELEATYERTCQEQRVLAHGA